MREKLAELVADLEPEIQALVAEVIQLEREYLDLLKPRGVKDEIRDAIDKYARYGLGVNEERAE